VRRGVAGCAIAGGGTFESGERLLYLIQWRWDVFDDDLPEGQQETLLEEIVNSDWDDDDGEDRLDAKELYMPKASQWFHNTHSDTWEQFCSDVRDDPGATIPFDEFIAEELAESEETLRAGTIFFRARLPPTKQQLRSTAPGLRAPEWFLDKQTLALLHASALEGGAQTCPLYLLLLNR
jgi:hypothetical protein